MTGNNHNWNHGEGSLGEFVRNRANEQARQDEIRENAEMYLSRRNLKRVNLFKPKRPIDHVFDVVLVIFVGWLAYALYLGTESFLIVSATALIAIWSLDQLYKRSAFGTATGWLMIGVLGIVSALGIAATIG